MPSAQNALSRALNPRLLLSLLALILSACASISPEPTATPTIAPTPTPAGPQELTICTADEPVSLYLYGDDSPAARSIRQAIYDGPFDLQDGLAIGTIFAPTPSLENGGARVEVVSVQEGDLIVDADGLITTLYEGLRVRPSGCRGEDCVIEFEGGQFQMDQLVVTYDLAPSLAWADGTPLTAADSLYSFRIAADPATPGDKSAIEHTAAYQALDEDSIEWRGLPGYLDPNFVRNFWSPLPEHVLGAIPAAELLSAAAAARTPLGWGAYTITDWSAGEAITLSRNPHYWRAAEGLPHFERLIIRFTGDGPLSNLQALQDGACDVLLPSTGIEAEVERLFDLEADGVAQLHFGSAGSWLHLDFGVQPLTYDNGHNPYNERPDFFSEPQMRRIFAQCVDRQTLLDQFAWGQGEIPNVYLSPDHALSNADASQYRFDPQAATAALESLGWVRGEDGVYLAQTVENVLPGTRLEVRLTTSDDLDSLAIADWIIRSLDDCGIAATVESGPAESIFAPGPDGPLFGRAFDLALFVWPLTDQPACYLYLSDAIPGPDPQTHPYAWGGWNLTGWGNPDFDAACQAAMNALPGENAHIETHALAQSIFAEELPALPLYLPQQIALTRPDFCGFDFTSGDPLAAIEEFGYAEWCE